MWAVGRSWIIVQQAPGSQGDCWLGGNARLEDGGPGEPVMLPASL